MRIIKLFIFFEGGFAVSVFALKEYVSNVIISVTNWLVFSVQIGVLC